MKEKFEEFLKNGLSEYDAQYKSDFDYIMLLNIKNEISSYFANQSFMFFVEYPQDNKSYDSALEVLEGEMELTNADSGIIYENKDGEFVEIAYINNQEKNQML